MVRGLPRFRDYFASYLEQYVLIGGTACSLVMEDVGLEFRATKDLDIVLYIEALQPNFVSTFWDFVKEGGYQNRQRSTGKEIFFRFDTPFRDDFPPMLELFSRITSADKMGDVEHVKRVKMDEFATSLSAILLDDDYYHFIHTGKVVIDKLSVLKATHLIPLKGCAWLDFIERQKNGSQLDNKDFRKHRNDIIRLSQIVPDEKIILPPVVKQDMHRVF